MDFIANCQTTAMGNMPHTDKRTALNQALNLDMPFFPQLPNLGFNDDLYVIASENFPGITISAADKRINFSTEHFINELPTFMENIESDTTIFWRQIYLGTQQSEANSWDL